MIQDSTADRSTASVPQGPGRCYDLEHKPWPPWARRPSIPSFETGNYRVPLKGSFKGDIGSYKG